jgi:hypothetical protein
MEPMLSALVALALASGPSWPIQADAQLQAKNAHVVITTTEAGTDVVVEVYGLDGLVVDGGEKRGNLLIRTFKRDALKPGEKWEFDVAITPGPGRSMLTVAARGAKIGSVVRSFSVGELSDAQVKERNKCVQQDADGTWIELMGCDQPPAAPAPAQVQPAPIKTKPGP